MEDLKIHNKALNIWVIVENGKVFDENTRIQFPSRSRVAVGALQYVEKQAQILREQLKAMNETQKGSKEYCSLQADLGLMYVALGIEA